MGCRGHGQSSREAVGPVQWPKRWWWKLRQEGPGLLLGGQAERLRLTLGWVSRWGISQGATVCEMQSPMGGRPNLPTPQSLYAEMRPACDGS